MSDDGLCMKCREAQQGEGQANYYNPNNVIAGRGKAIGSVVAAGIAIICMLFSVYAITTAIDEVGMGDLPAGVDIPSMFMYSGFLFGAAGIVLAVVSTIFSVQSIKTYRNIISWGSKQTPKMTLVMGIIGGCVSAVADLLAIPVIVIMISNLVRFIDILIFGV